MSNDPIQSRGGQRQDTDVRWVGGVAVVGAGPALLEQGTRVEAEDSLCSTALQVHVYL